MKEEKNIKNINRKYLVGYMLLNCLIFLVISGGLMGGFQEVESLYKKTTNLLGFLLIPLSIILEGVFSSDLKHKLVFWRIRNPLPGSRVFSEIAPKDPRIDMTRLKFLFANGIPNDPESQNKVWYGLYKKYSSRDRVFDAHKSFLLTRDLAALSFILMPLTLTAYVVCGISSNNVWMHLGLLISIFLLASIACQHYGKRFAANVIAEAIHDRE